MSIAISPSTSIERKLLVIETMLNSTDKISKISDESIVSGVAGGIAKVTGKAEKDIILAMSQIFPDSAYADQLDQVGKNFGVSGRFGVLGSTTFIRISALAGTQYFSAVHTFQSTSGFRFILDQDVTIPSFGFTYAKVRSIENGLKANVDPLTISVVSPVPTGHLNVINEYKADGGRDIESDETYRIRIKDGANILARGTLAMLEQVFISINSNVLNIYNQGTGLNGKIRIAISTQNGADLTPAELNALLVGSAEYFSLTELKPFGSQFYGIELIPIEWQYVDVSLRADIDSSADVDQIRKDIQVSLSKYCDWRYFNSSKQKIEWDNMLQICKNANGVKYVPDQYFYPRTDTVVNVNKLPRLRGFLLLDMNGKIIQNYQGTLVPSYYPNQADFSYQSTVLNLI